MAHRFPWIILSCTIFLLAALAILSVLAAPPGYQWLGDGIHNSSDVAVYLSYLRQGADHHFLLSDLYAVEPHAPRFDLVWSTLGAVARSGINLIVLHELARLCFAAILLITLWKATTDYTHRDEDTRLALLLLLGGVGTGWLYSIWLGMHGAWTPTTYAAPDIVTEFAIGPILLGGAHAALSLALLLTAIRGIWNGVTMLHKKHAAFGALAGTALLSFHPYFAPLLAGIGILAWIRSPHRRRAFVLLTGIGFFYLLPVGYYAWLLRDPVFGPHHLSANILPLAPLSVWTVTLAPFLLAGVWMWRTRTFSRSFSWPHAWLIILLVLLIALPVPWKRKLTEGALVPIIILTMPAWFALRDWARTSPSTVLRSLMSGLLLFCAFLGPFHLVTSHLVWIASPLHREVFFRPDAVFAAAKFIRATSSDDAILLADVPWTNTWLPALTGRRVWIGHDHETPNFSHKRALYHELLETTDAERARDILKDAHITHLILTDDAQTQRLVPMLGATWTRVFSEGTVSIWIPTSSL